MSKTYFSIYADKFALMKSQLSADEIIEMLQALSELCMWEETDYVPQTKKQSYFWELLKSKFDDDEELYNQRSRAGKEGAKKRWDSKADSKSDGKTDSKTYGKSDGKTYGKTDSQITNNKQQDILSSDKSSESIIISPKNEKKPKNYPAEFEQFWQEYPRKVDKEEAYKKFRTIMLQKRATLDELIAGAKRYFDEVLQKKTDTQYIKHASTWLNNLCWLNEYQEDPPRAKSFFDTPEGKEWLRKAEEEERNAQNGNTCF